MMAKIGFIGLGNMGGPMAANLAKAGHRVRAFDLNAASVAAAVAAGAAAAESVAEAVAEAEIIVTMLPAGPQVRKVYLGGPDAPGVLSLAAPGALLIDCSTIDVDTARAVAAAAEVAQFAMVDAPVSGGVGGAVGGTLTFMVGGPDAAFERAKPVLEAMGKTIVHTGAAGNGQAAKICNNMILGISMIAVSEAFSLGRKLGLDPETLFAVSSKSSGQCWAMTSYCPEPGPVPTSPANRDYAPGFAAGMMGKDLALAQSAALSVGASTPLGAAAAALYALYCGQGNSNVDFSGIIKLFR
jgi:3-hydroxyisobutyrate dehydrogenase